MNINTTTTTIIINPTCRRSMKSADKKDQSRSPHEERTRER